MSESAYKQGYAAYPAEDNPYWPECFGYDEWNNGWNDAKFDQTDNDDDEEDD